MKRLINMAIAASLMLTLATSYAGGQNRRTTTSVAQPQTTTPTAPATSSSSNTRRSSAQQTNQSQPSQTSQPNQTSQTNRRPATTTTNSNTGGFSTRRSSTSTSQPQPSQPQNARPSDNDNPTSTKPGGSSTHINGNVSNRPNGQTNAKPGNQPAHKPAGQQARPNNNIAMPKYKPMKQPERYNPSRPAVPKPTYKPGYHMYGTEIRTLPTGYKTYHRNNVTYYYLNGIFYRANGSRIVICRPPVGFTIRINSNYDGFLAPQVIIDIHRDPQTRIEEAIWLAQYFEYVIPGYRRPDDKFYTKNVTDQNYQIYYGMDGTYYSVSGGYYYVVNPPIGALTDRLPYDYEEYFINGRTFYKVDNILYTVVAPEGIPYYEIFSLL